MNYIYSKVSSEKNFYGNSSPVELAEKYGTPLYVYNENILRKRCRDLKGLIAYPNFTVNYSPKANSNLEIIKIVRSEGLRVDAMSPGEIYVNLMAGFKPDEIFFISNNVSEEEFKFAIQAGVKISVDSISQLELFGRINPGGEVAFRINPGVGAGHHEKVTTGGQKTKFGIEMSGIPEAKAIIKKYNLKLIGINQHIGSLFMDGEAYLKSSENILSVARQFEDLEFIDLGGGFGIPYRKQANQSRLDLKVLGDRLSGVINDWVREYGKEIEFKVEPGRYIVAESCILLGSVFAVKMNYGIKYIGTDLGFNVLLRPTMYDSHHDVEIYRKSNMPSLKEETVRIVGNICETGDIIAKDRKLPEIFEHDILGIMDSGAYGFSMSSNYNNRLRPAEVLIDKDGNTQLIRKRDTFEDLVRNFINNRKKIILMEKNSFVKMHGLGNEYIVLDSENIDFKLTAQAIKRLCNIHFGIGSDGIVMKVPSAKAEFGFRVYNPDGSEAEKSGNGLRILCKYLYDYQHAKSKKFSVETLTDIVYADIVDEIKGKAALIRVDMGKAIFRSRDIPVNSDLPEFIGQKIKAGDREFEVNCVSVGNPHCVVIKEELDEQEIRKYGPLLENHPMFPNRINVQFAKPLSDHDAQILIWERGAGFTLASGSSSCAASSVLVKKQLVKGDLTMHMLGGNLNIQIDKDWNIRMTGEVREITRGVLSPELLEDLNRSFAG